MKNWKNKLTAKVLWAILILNSFFGTLIIMPEYVGSESVDMGTSWYGLTKGVRSIATKDINNDGHTDFITADSGQAPNYFGNVSVLSNDGGGNFKNRTSYYVGHGTNSVAIGDLDSDQDEDIVFTNQRDNNVGVLSNNGQGIFGDKITYNVGNSPSQANLNDIDGDNDLDLIVANEGDNDVSVLINNGKGEFGNKVDYSVEKGPCSLDMGDIDKDNDLDVITVNQDQSGITILYNDGNGEFRDKRNLVCGIKLSSIVLADIDRDNDIDVIVTDYFNNEMIILKNNGLGQFQNNPSFSTGVLPNDVAVGDIDNDTDVDVIVSNYITGSFSVLFNNGKGVFRETIEFDIGVYARAVSIADVDGDRDLDVAVIDSWNQNADVVILINNGMGSFGPRTDYEYINAPKQVLLGDVIHNHILDMISIIDNNISVAHNNGGGIFGNTTKYPVGNNPSAIELADLNEDDYNDIIIVNKVDNDVSIYYNDGWGGFYGKTDYDVGLTPKSVAVNDIDDDEDVDIITCNYDGDTVTVLLNDGSGQFGNRADYSTSLGIGEPFEYGPIDIAVENVDKWDGDDIIVIKDFYYITILSNWGDGTFPGNGDTWAVTGHGPRSITTGDIDLDNDFDIVTSNIGYDDVTVLYNNGGSFSDRHNFQVGNTPLAIALGDLDGDLDQEVVTANTLTGSSTVLKNNGKGIFSIRKDYNVGRRPVSLALGNLGYAGDRLRREDIVVANEGDNTITILKNDGEGNFFLDSDEDGFPDCIDDFSNNPNEWIDSDNDGFGDFFDAIPWDPLEYRDVDGDGKGDRFSDAFPNNIVQWKDSDGDGYGDNRPWTNVTIKGVIYYVKNGDMFPSDSLEWADRDNDTVGDNGDFMPLDPSQQFDSDGDGYGDNVTGTRGDAFPYDATEWLDFDKDGTGDNSDEDDDEDGYSDPIEISEGSNPRNNTSIPKDTDNDFIPDSTDDDIDGDGYSNDIESGAKTDKTDIDDYPLDTDDDGMLDYIDDDDDNDGYLDVMESSYGTSSKIYNKTPPDNDKDLTPDDADTDDDNDGIIDGLDAFPMNPSGTVDTDKDGEPDYLLETSTLKWFNQSNILAEDTDDDDDGFNDADDAFPLNSIEWSDHDGDGIGDNSDTDDDNDGYSDENEKIARSNPFERNSIPGNMDGDDLLDYLDTDIDGDGYNNELELSQGTDPNNSTSFPLDLDVDFIPDSVDTDDDSDGYLDIMDAFPMNPSGAIDTDGDGNPDDLLVFDAQLWFNSSNTLMEDLDDDGDGVKDSDEPQYFSYDGSGNNKTLLFRLDPMEWKDTDGDHIGDNADDDADGDGLKKTGTFLFIFDKSDTDDSDPDKGWLLGNSIASSTFISFFKWLGGLVGVVLVMFLFKKVKFVYYDKKIADANTLEELEELYKNQIEIAMNQWKVDVVGSRHLNKDYRTKKRILKGKLDLKEGSFFKNFLRRAFIYSKKDFIKAIDFGKRSTKAIPDEIKDIAFLGRSKNTGKDKKQLIKPQEQLRCPHCNELTSGKNNLCETCGGQLKEKEQDKDAVEKGGITSLTTTQTAEYPDKTQPPTTSNTSERLPEVTIETEEKYDHSEIPKNEEASNGHPIFTEHTKSDDGDLDEDLLPPPPQDP